MRLEAYQRGLHHIITTGEPRPGDPEYVQSLRNTARLEVVREIVHFWRAHALETFCVLTVPWLKRLGRFDAEVGKFITTSDLSPFIEVVGLQFLRYLEQDSDQVVQALARFETALHETREDISTSRTIDWPCDPRPVLDAIFHSDMAVAPLEALPHRVTVCRALPGGFLSRPVEES
jgi:hypothetical protein